MTCILGYQDPETRAVYIAADGMTCCGDEITRLSANKIVRCGPYTVGIAGQTRVQNLVENDPEFRGVASVWQLAQLLYRKIPEIGVTPEEEKRSVKCWGFGMVVAGPDNDGALGLFSLGQGCEFSRIEPGRPTAHGSGGEAAAGAMHALLDAGSVRPGFVSVAVKQAVEAACKVISSCGGEIRVEGRNPRYDGTTEADPVLP